MNSRASGFGLRGVAIAVLVMGATPVDAEEVKEAEPGVVSTLVAVVPGTLASGAGTLVAGDRKTAHGIFTLKLVGLGVASAGGLPMFATGASRRTTGLTMPLVLTGAGLFMSAWVADIYGASTGGREVGPFGAAPIEVSAGYAYAPDPQFDYDHFAVVSADFSRGAWRGTPSAWIALDDDVQRVRAEGAWRFRAAEDGSFLEAVTAATLHRHGDDDFEVYTGEVGLLGRYDMARLGGSLRGSFLEAGVGFGVETYAFSDDLFFEDLPLARAGYGVYLGRGEAQVYYDHRHDEIAGGLGTGLTFDGPYGHFGVEGRYWLTDRWGVDAQLEVGSVYVTRLSLTWGLR